MRTNNLKQALAVLTVFLWTTFASAQETSDSLSHYLEQAARNNPQVRSELMIYKASLEKIPQAGAYPDPELEIGFYLNPMETLMGNQVADFKLMQMFPWFGTRKAARNEASEMARMAYEKFRESRDNLWYEVKSKWYQLSNLSEQHKTTQANIDLLIQLEQLAINRFSASSAQGVTSVASPKSIDSSASPPAAAGGMSGMGGSASAMASSSSSASGMSGGGMGGGMNASSGGGMADVLRIQLERAELDNNLENIRSARLVAEAQFNALLSRSSDAAVVVPDSLEQRVFLLDDAAIMDRIFAQNPMLTMLDAEGRTYRAKAKMNLRMSYPMIGIGLQYSPISKSDNPMVMADMNGKDMVMPMLTVSLPLFRKKYNAQQRESRNYWLANELKRDNVQNQLQAEYVGVRQQLEDAARKVELYTRQYALSLSTWQLMIREFSTGRQSLTDVIQVERQMLDYKLKKSESIAAYNTTVASVERLVSTSLASETK